MILPVSASGLRTPPPAGPADAARGAGGPGPHSGQRLVTAGVPPERARLAVVMLHGRGGAPEDMVGLAEHLAQPDLAILAPEAAGRSWWPESFLAPLAANEPGLGSGLAIVESLLDDLEKDGIGPERTVLVGFSQGACLAIEAAARLGRPLRAVAALSGALVGTAEAGGAPRDDLYGRSAKRLDHDTRLDGVPVLLGCHERDPHIPLARVHESERVLRAMGAAVDTIVIAGVGHGIVTDEISWLRRHLSDDS